MFAQIFYEKTFDSVYPPIVLKRIEKTFLDSAYLSLNVKKIELWYPLHTQKNDINQHYCPTKSKKRKGDTKKVYK